MAKKKEENQQIRISANNDNQRNFIKSNCDFVIATGSAGSSKTYGACMLNSYDILNNPNFSAIYLRQNIEDFFKPGSIAETLNKIYPLRKEKTQNSNRQTIGTMKTSQNMGVYFDNGAQLLFKHVADQNKDKIVDSFKGLQVHRFIFDEADMFDAHTVLYSLTRLRGEGSGKRQIVVVQNPERECWVRQFCGSGEFGGGWIGDDGVPIRERNGTVRFFSIDNGDINTAVWGKTKEEVYDKCRGRIDKLLYEADGVDGVSYKSFIFSCVFFHMKTTDNKDVLKNNPDYLGSLAMSTGSKSMFEANWNYSKHDKKDENDVAELGLELTSQMVLNMFNNPPNIGNRIKIVVDPAFEGIDNFTMAAFLGYHCIDLVYYRINTPDELAGSIRNFMLKHNARESDLIIDGGKESIFLRSKFRHAYMYLGTHQTSAKGKTFHRLRDEAGYIMCKMIQFGRLTFDSRLANMIYSHQKAKDKRLIDAFCEEAKCYTFRTMPVTNKHKLLNKSDQAFILSGRSADLTDLLLMLCGSTLRECYDELAGVNLDKINIGQYLNNNIQYNQRDEVMREKKPIRNIASILSNKFSGRW